VNAVASLSTVDGNAEWTGDIPTGVPETGDPLEVLGTAWRTLRGPRLPGLPPLTGGFVGYLSYDVVRRLERLPEKAVDDLGFPELNMLLVTDLAAVDHHECTVVLIANAIVSPGMSELALDAAYDDAVARLDAMEQALATPAPSTVANLGVVPPRQAESRTPPGEFQHAVELGIEAIRSGEVFQVVLGQRFEVQTPADPFDVYRVLRTLNPSPYMYLVRMDGFDIVGSSPEALVTVHSGQATIHPIAGTRKRGATAERDAELVAELVNDPKERAEHVMLVDLARNDLGRVCKPGTVKVVDFGIVERYSHLWHIVSTVTGDVADSYDALDVFVAAFPHGTVTGAPKVRAMELIEEFEPVRRGIYAGALGYLDPAGDVDMAIAFRTAIMRDGVAYVQAGAGIVADSVPALEDKETRNKARAVLQAIATAETLRPVQGR